MTKRIDWRSSPMVWTIRTRCPHCHTFRRPTIVRSEAENDGSVMRRCICQDCGKPYKEILEPDSSLRN